MQLGHVVIIAIGCLLVGIILGVVIVAPLLSEDAPIAPPAQRAPQPATLDPWTQSVQEGNAAMDAGKYREALAAYDRALAIRFDANVATDRGVCFREMGERDRALIAFEFVTMKEPAHWQARYDKAVLLLEMHRYAEAQSEADVLVREQPNEPAVKQLADALARQRAAR